MHGSEHGKGLVSAYWPNIGVSRLHSEPEYGRARSGSPLGTSRRARREVAAYVGDMTDIASYDGQYVASYVKISAKCGLLIADNDRAAIGRTLAACSCRSLGHTKHHVPMGLQVDRLPPPARTLEAQNV